MKRKILLRIEEIILLFLILLNVLDFAEALSQEFDYIKKVVSFVLMFYLLYQVSLSKQFFGTKNSDVDFLLVFAMFVMVIVKNAVSVALVAEKGFFTPFFNLLIINAGVFEMTSFYVGSLLLLGLAVFYSFKVPIRSPSLLSVISEKNDEPVWQKVFTNYLLFLTFFLFFFNLLFEWLTIAIDAPLISIGLIGYLFLSWRKHHLDPESTLFKVGNFGESFFKGFVKHFKYKNTLLLGIVGMLILHLFTDIGVFIIPAFTGFHDPLYEVAVRNNSTLWDLAKQVAPSYGIALLFFLQYFFSAVGLLFLMIFPSFVWYSVYFRKKIFSSRIFMSLFFSSVFSLLLTPIFSIIPIKEDFSGVAIITAPKVINLWVSLTGFVCVFLSVFLLYKHYSRIFTFGAVIISSSFFFWYIINYSLSVINYYVGATIYLILGSHYYLAVHFFIFLMLIIIFYLIGFWLYLRTAAKAITI